MTHPEPTLRPPWWEKPTVLTAAWLVPGLGYGLKGDWGLFLANFVVLQGAFLVGLVGFDAPIVVPVLNWHSDEFSLINLFVLGGQLLSGLGALVAAVGYHLDPGSAARETAGFLGARPWVWYADLGNFYLVLAGVLNFFAILGTWDRYYAAPPATSDAPPAAAASRPAGGRG